VALFPGVPRAVTRHVEVPADAADVMRWLRDSERREQNWRAQTEFLESLPAWQVSHLRNGGLKFDFVQVKGGTMVRRTIKDAAITTSRIDRTFLVRQTTRSAPRLRRRSSWRWRQSVRIEPAGTEAAAVKVRIRGRPARLTIVTHFLLSEDSTQALKLTRMADKLADSTVAAIQRQFTPAREPG
jgi:hypothetical protein